MKKIWILTAMQEEAELIIIKYWLQKTNQLNTISFYENDDIILALSGVGKVQASIATTLMIKQYQPNYLLNIWIAGNLAGDKASVGDVFLINRVSQHDMYLPFDWSHLSYAKGQISLPLSLHLTWERLEFWLYEHGYCLTGDQFIDDVSTVKNLRHMTQADVVEMEAFAFASVARELEKLDKTFIIKAISDGADNNAKSAHMDNLHFAMQNSILILDEIVRKLD